MASRMQHFMAWARRVLGYWNDDREMEHEGKAEQVAIAFEEADDPVVPRSDELEAAHESDLPSKSE
jgi:hypothetical protein